MRNLLCLILMIGLCLFSSCDKGSTINKYDIELLESQAKEVDSMFNVSSRKYVDIYFELSDAYYFKKDYQKSYNAIIKGLRLDSLNTLYQCRAAELEFKNKEYTASYQRIQYILNITDNEDVISKCNKILKLILQDKIDIKDIVVTPMFSKRLIVCIYPEVNELFSKAIIDKIKQEYKLDIIEIHTEMNENELNMRDGFNDYLVTSIKNIYENNAESTINSLLDRIKIKKEQLITKENRILFIKSIYLESGKTESEWNIFVQQFSEQYDANKILEQINLIIATINTTDVIGVCAITNKDIYSGENENNFLFGLSKDNTAVMSLNRFETSHTANSVIIKRVIMQSLASTGHIIGIPRCTTKTCARAYANSLDEQDYKDDKLCFECIKNINNVYSTW